MRASTEEEEDQHPTPRMNTTTTPTPSLAGRLRELIQLVPNGNPTVHRPPSPVLHESDFEADSTSGGHSHARESLRDIFSKALREPGNTPQKGRPRRDSDSTASESDALPDSSRNQPDLKGKKKSVNNGHSVHPLRKSHVSLLSYLALTG